MPTLTFYVTEEVKDKLEKLIEIRSKRLGFVVSRGDIIVPHIKNEFDKELIGKELKAKKNKKPVIVTGEISGVASTSAGEGE